MPAVDANLVRRVRQWASLLGQIEALHVRCPHPRIFGRLFRMLGRGPWGVVYLGSGATSPKNTGLGRAYSL
jgi:hypothetical protein